MGKEVQLVIAEWEAGGAIHQQVSQLVAAADNAAGRPAFVILVGERGWVSECGGARAKRRAQLKATTCDCLALVCSCYWMLSMDDLTEENWR